MSPMGFPGYPTPLLGFGEAEYNRTNVKTYLLLFLADFILPASSMNTIPKPIKIATQIGKIVVESKVILS